MFEDLTYAGQQEEDEFRQSEVIKRMVASKELQPMDTVELVPLSKEERESRAREEAARKKVLNIVTSCVKFSVRMNYCQSPIRNRFH